MRRVARSPEMAHSGVTPAVFTRWRETSKNVTSENAERPAWNPAAFSATSAPMGETMPIPVTTTRRLSESVVRCGGQAKGQGG